MSPTHKDTKAENNQEEMESHKKTVHEMDAQVKNEKDDTIQYKEGSSELGGVQADSAYSSTYSSLRSIKQPPSGQSTFNAKADGDPLKEKCSFGRFRHHKLSSKSSSGSNYKAKRRSGSPTKDSEPKTHAALDRSHEKTDHVDAICNISFPKVIKVKAESPEESCPPAHDFKAQKVATLQQALSLVDNFKKQQAANANKTSQESDLNDLAGNLLGAVQSNCSRPSLEFQPLSGDGSNPGSPANKSDTQDSFCVAVSLNDGAVMHTTSSLTGVLGYPKEMWVGRSFIDFIHQDDRDTFISQVTQSISMPLADMRRKESTKASGCFFCRIRSYNGLKSGFSIKERKTRYNPFKLCICFSEVDNPKSESSTKTPSGQQVIYMFITAIPILPAYTEPFQVGPVKLSTGQLRFVSKHTPQCKFSWFDECALAYTGYLPQNIIGQDIFSYIHSGDLPLLKEAFDAVMMEHGKPFRSKPLRLKINNGSFITVSSWWSSFINPWSKQLEFIHGKHTVTQGPKNLDIFNNKGSLEDISPALSKQDELIIEDIRRKLSRMPSTVIHYPVNPTSKNKKELTNFMSSLLEEVAKAENHKDNKSLVIGDVSPHYSDSSESPPSYNQLAYNENLTRFFNSQPQTLTEDEVNKITDKGPFHTTAYTTEYKPEKGKEKQSKQRSKPSSGVDTTNDSGEGSGEQQQESGSGEGKSGSGEGTRQNSSNLPTGLSAGQAQQGGDDGMCSQDGSGSGSRMGSGSRGSDTYKGPPITVELMEVHNKDMEMKMLASFKEAKRNCEIRLLKDGTKQGVAQTKKVGLSKEESRHQNISTIKKPSVTVVTPKHNSIKEIKVVEQNRRLSKAGWMAQIHQHARQHSQDRSSSQRALIPVPEAATEVATSQELPGFPDQFIGVPAVYIPISQVAPTGQIPPGILMQGASYVPMGMMYSAAPVGAPLVRGKTGSHPDLPNCLAVESCMVIQPPTYKFGGLPPFSSGDPKPGPSYLSTSSSSLYSFLKTSTESNANNASDEETLKVVKVVERKVPIQMKPEPFWNTQVDWNNDLRFKYTMTQTDLEEVLLSDKQKLINMTQPKMADKQLEALCDEFDEGVELEEFLEDFEGPPTDDETETEPENDTSEENLEEKLIKLRRKKQHLDKMNIFMEAEAPFPIQDSPSPVPRSHSLGSTKKSYSWHSSVSSEGSKDDLEPEEVETQEGEKSTM